MQSLKKSESRECSFIYKKRKERKNAMKTSKKIVSLLLCVLMLLPFSAVALAAENATPVVVVSGFGSYPLYSSENGEETQVFPPQTKDIMSVVGDSVLPLAGSAVSGDWNLFADKCFGKIYSKLFEIISCDETGESRHSVSAVSFPLSVNNYPEILEHKNEEDEQGVTKAIAGAVGAQNVYYFNYDWRLDPLKTADDLNSYIENVKKEKNSEKVILVPCSMGGVITNSYLYKYGCESVEKIVYCLVASKGIDLVGELFSKNVEIDTDMLLERLFSFERGDIFTQTLISALQTGVEMTPALSKAVDSFVKKFIAGSNDRAYNEILSVSFASMPGMWSFCPDSYYENAKSTMFPNDTNAEFIARLDEYHYNVQNRSEELIKAAESSGCDVYITAAYGYVGFPAAKSAWEQSDCLVETKNESFGATCAPYGKNLGEGYTAMGTVCADESHNHLSRDGIIDASTCLLPEKTWFIKYMKHVGFRNGSEASELLLWLVTSEEEQTIYSNEKYPQFTEFNNTTQKLSSLTGGEVSHSILDEHSSLRSRIAEFFRNLRALFEKLFSKVK